MSNNSIELCLDDQNSVTINLHGSTITSWVSNGQEILFVSKKSVFDNKKAIRGGIPIVFPNFGPWSLGPQHGFARTKQWSVKAPIQKTSDSCCVSLALIDDEETRKLWDFKFELVYEVQLSINSLKTNLVVHNNDDNEFDFTSLLHTYFKLDDISSAKVSNLIDCAYTDKVNNGQILNEKNHFVQISGETDRVYYSTNDEHLLTTGNSNKTNIMIKKKNFPETVVWNPWIEKAKGMSDFDDNEYKSMICVEAGYVKDRFVLKSHEKVTMGQELVVRYDN